MACALRGAGKRVLVVESAVIGSDSQPAYDERTVALTYSSRNVFSALGVWEQIEKGGAQPILDIHVSNRGGFGQVRLSCKDAGTEALGYVVPVRNIGNVLWEMMNQSDAIEFQCPAKVVSVNVENEYCQVGINHDRAQTQVTADLLVVADGGRSQLAQQLGYAVSDMPYGQSAILSMVRTDRPHRGQAYERFLNDGPLALLPHRIDQGFLQPGGSACDFALVWTVRNRDVAQRLSLNDEEFLDSLQSAFGGRAGNFFEASPRKSYPLSRVRVDCPALKRSVLIGNAAHAVHPVAGQGFNLGLRDVACLAHLITESKFPLGSAEMAGEYVRLRRRDAWAVESFTHALIQAFASSSRPLSWIRNASLAAMEHFPPAKRLLLRSTMGLKAVPQKLTSGIPVS